MSVQKNNTQEIGVCKMSDLDVVKFSETLKTMLKKHEMSGKMIASLLGVSEGSVSSWLSGTATPSDINVYKRCARIFSISLHEMIYGIPEVSDGQLEVRKKIEDVANALSAGRFELIIRPIRES
ncbi:MAG: helix-turn-helix transcriptional regulator [Oligoflexia bacterium]|nr:helix-turn-helix transcriptional regulator [Oligoflexia bacterium]